MPGRRPLNRKRENAYAAKVAIARPETVADTRDEDRVEEPVRELGLVEQVLEVRSIPNSFGMSDVELSVPSGLKAAEATNRIGISAKMTARMATMCRQPTAKNQLWPVIG